MRKIFLLSITLCSLVWGTLAPGQNSQNFGTQNNGSTNYITPRFQMRYSAQRFNPPLIVDIGGTSGTENIMQIVPLTIANTLTFRVIPPGQATVISYPDPGAGTATIPYLERSQTWTSTNTFTGGFILAGAGGQLQVQATSNQMSIGPLGGNMDTLTFPTPSAARTITFADPGGNANVFYSNGTTAQNLLANAFQITDGTDTTKQLIFNLSGVTTAKATTFTFANTLARTVTWPDASVTINGAVFTDCGNNTTCSPTTISSTVKIVKGICTASSATTCTVGSMPAFTSSSSYVCNVTDGTTAANNALKITYVSSSSFTITTTSSSDAFSYACIGT